MAKLWKNLFLVLLLVGPCLIQMFGTSGQGSLLVMAQDDDDASEDFDDSDDGVVEDEGANDATTEEILQTQKENQGYDEEAPDTLKPHPDAVTSILFIKPVGQADIPAGREAVVVVGLSNEADKQLVVQTLEASIRYPQDFSYYIQNFTTYSLEQAVDAGKEASFEYRFTPSDSLSSRPFGLVISLNYKDEDGLLYSDAVYNSTINISEPDEGMDGEIVFMYIFLVVIVILGIVGGTQVLSTIKKKHMGIKTKQTIELGTQNKGDVDYDWLPEETLQELKKSPKPSPVTRTSPRQRNKKRLEGQE